MAASALIIVGENQPLIDQLVANTAALKPGQKAGEVGPVIDLLAKNRILDYINDAEKNCGAKVCRYTRML